MWSIRIQKLLSYLTGAEGWKVHRNRNEDDVTAFYGCYRIANPTFAGWIWLDDIASNIGCESYRHIKRKRDLLNDWIANSPIYMAIYDDLSKMFHYKNTRNLGLENFPSFKTAKTYFSLYTNSNVGGTKSLQRALRRMGYMVVVDGVIGKNTLAEVAKVTDSKELNRLMLHFMQRYYNALVKQSPTRFKIFAKGWTNRLTELA